MAGMSISLEHRRVDGIHVVTCKGRIVEGKESDDVREYLDHLLQFGPDIIINVGGVDFVDSSGLGLLVRYTTRTRNASGMLKLCSVPAKLATILKATRLDSVLDAYDTESDAITAFYRRPTATVNEERPSDVLCVIESIDLQALVRELLIRAGFGVRTASNLPDGLILLQVTRPKVIVIDHDLRHGPRTSTGAKFDHLASSMPIVELPEGFASRDPGEAAQELLARIRTTST